MTTLQKAGRPGTQPGLSRVLASHGVEVAYLFGSRAAGTARPDSDHDVAVLFESAEPALDATVRRVRFEVDARMRWIEFRPVLQETTRAYLHRVARAGLR